MISTRPRLVEGSPRIEVFAPELFEFIEQFCTGGFVLSSSTERLRLWAAYEARKGRSLNKSSSG